MVPARRAAPALTRRNHVSGGKDTSVSADHGPPGHSRGGPLTTDRPTAENPGEELTAHRTPAHRRNATRREEPINVWAHAYLVVGTRGRCRLVLVVPSCVFCGRPHAHNGKPDFTAGKRTASCHEGRYVVHLGTVAGDLAA